MAGRVVGLTLGVALLLALTASSATMTWRDDSGLLVTTRAPSQALPAPLSDPYAIARRIADENRTDFGQPLVLGDHVLLPVTSERSRAIGQTSGPEQEAALRAYERAREKAPSDPSVAFEKTLVLDSEAVLAAFASGLVQAAPGEVSAQETDDTQDRIIRLAVRDEFASAEVWMLGTDIRTGRYVLHMTRLTPDLADTLVDHFGTSSILVVEEKRQPSSPA
jgi:hypothetical protein